MNLTLEEKKKLLQKATELYEEIIKIKIRKDIIVDTITKYYSTNSRYTNYGLHYYTSGSLSIHANSIKDCITELEHYIEEKETDPDKYVYISLYTIDSLLDFIYNKDRIINTINRVNESERQELKDLLN